MSDEALSFPLLSSLPHSIEDKESLLVSQRTSHLVDRVHEFPDCPRKLDLITTIQKNGRGITSLRAIAIWVRTVDLQALSQSCSMWRHFLLYNQDFWKERCRKDFSCRCLLLDSDLLPPKESSSQTSSSTEWRRHYFLIYQHFRNCQQPWHTSLPLQRPTLRLNSYLSLSSPTASLSINSGRGSSVLQKVQLADDDGGSKANPFQVSFLFLSKATSSVRWTLPNEPPSSGPSVSSSHLFSVHEIELLEQFLRVLMIHGIPFWDFDLLPVVNGSQETTEMSTLHLAISRGSPISVLRLLVRGGASVNVKVRDIGTPLHFVISHVHSHHTDGQSATLAEEGTAPIFVYPPSAVELVEWLIDEAGANQFLYNHLGFSALTLACKLSAFDVVESLLSRCALQLDLEEPSGFLPIEIALKFSTLDICRLLLSHQDDCSSFSSLSADTDSCNEERGNLDESDKQESNGKPAEQQVGAGCSLEEEHDGLSESSPNGGSFSHLPLSPVVSSPGWMKRISVDRRHRIFHLAASKKMWDLLPLIIATHQLSDFGAEQGHTLLVGAVINGDVDLVEWLLKVGQVDPNQSTRQNKTRPLHHAAISHQTLLIDILVQWGAEVNCSSLYGDSPLHWACSEGHLPSIRSMLLYGADVSLKNKSGNTPLHLLAREGHTEVVEKLADFFRPVVDEKNIFDLPAAFLGAENSHWGTVEALVRHASASVNARSDSQSLLHMAVEFPTNKQLVDLLLHKGAEVNVLDESGHTPLVI